MELREIMKAASLPAIAVEIIGEEADTPETRARLAQREQEPEDLLPGLWEVWQAASPEQRAAALAAAFAGLAGWPDDPK